jgi:hypothetical protein
MVRKTRLKRGRKNINYKINRSQKAGMFVPNLPQADMEKIVDVANSGSPTQDTAEQLLTRFKDKTAETLKGNLNSELPFSNELYTNVTNAYGNKGGWTVYLNNMFEKWYNHLPAKVVETAINSENIYDPDDPNLSAGLMPLYLKKILDDIDNIDEKKKDAEPTQVSKFLENMADGIREKLDPAVSPVSSPVPRPDGSKRKRRRKSSKTKRRYRKPKKKSKKTKRKAKRTNRRKLKSKKR